MEQDELLDTSVGEASYPPAAVEYKAVIWAHGCSVVIETYDESKLADLVHYCKAYLDERGAN